MSEVPSITHFRDEKEHFSAIYRIHYPMMAMEHHKAAKFNIISSTHFNPYGEIDSPEIIGADIVSFAQVIVGKETPGHQSRKNLSVPVVAKMIKDMGKLIAYDCDDLYFDAPSNLSVKHQKINLDATIKIMEMADLITVVSPHLGKMIQKYANINPSKIVYIPNMTPVSFWNKLYTDPYVISQRLRKKSDGKIHIGMMGTMNHYPDWNFIMPVFKSLKKKYGDKIVFECFGIGPREHEWIQANPDMPAPFKVEANKLWEEMNELGFVFIPQKKDPFEFFETMCMLAWDIGIATLSNTNTDKSKSFLKYLDYGMSRIPGVYRGISPLSDAVKYGFNGLTANHIDEWVENISVLIENEGLRNQIRSNAVQDITEHYDIDKQYVQWVKAYSDTIKRNTGVPEATKPVRASN
jgi:glycosyltransferase involved in cell wall biosynthesis